MPPRWVAKPRCCWTDNAKNFRRLLLLLLTSSSLATLSKVCWNIHIKSCSQHRKFNSGGPTFHFRAWNLHLFVWKLRQVATLDLWERQDQLSLCHPSKFGGKLWKSFEILSYFAATNKAVAAGRQRQDWHENSHHSLLMKRPAFQIWPNYRNPWPRNILGHNYREESEFDCLYSKCKTKMFWKLRGNVRAGQEMTAFWGLFRSNLRRRKTCRSLT